MSTAGRRKDRIGVEARLGSEGASDSGVGPIHVTSLTWIGFEAAALVEKGLFALRKINPYLAHNYWEGI